MKREVKPLTKAGLEAVARSHLSGREKKLLATCQHLQSQIEELERQHEYKKVEEYREWLGKPRVLTLVSRTHIEVAYDPNIELHICGVPDVRTEEEAIDAVRHVTRHVPDHVREIADDDSAEYKRYSLRTMSYFEWKHVMKGSSEVHALRVP